MLQRIDVSLWVQHRARAGAAKRHHLECRAVAVGELPGDRISGILPDKVTARERHTPARVGGTGAGFATLPLDTEHVVTQAQVRPALVQPIRPTHLRNAVTVHGVTPGKIDHAGHRGEVRGRGPGLACEEPTHHAVGVPHARLQGERLAIVEEIDLEKCLERVLVAVWPRNGLSEIKADP